jgi:hypothetical protein
MSLIGDVTSALKNIVLIQDKVSKLSEDVKILFETTDNLKDRLARLEGKFELLERMGAARTRRLPPQQ